MLNLDFLKLMGIALIVLAVTGPVSYCKINSDRQLAVLKRLCIERNGEWTTGWVGPHCEWPKDDKS